MKNIKIIIITFAFMIPSILHGQSYTNLTTVKSNLIFNKTGGGCSQYTLSSGGGAGPYEITSGNIEVDYGVVLTVETSLFFDNTSSGIIVHVGGLLILKGDITLTSKSHNPMGWTGIQVEGGAKNYCIGSVITQMNTTWFPSNYSTCDYGMLNLDLGSGSSGPSINNSTYGAVAGKWDATKNKIDDSKTATGGFICCFHANFTDNAFMSLGYANHFSSSIQYADFRTTSALTAYASDVPFVKIINTSAPIAFDSDTSAPDKTIQIIYSNFQANNPNGTITERGIVSESGIFVSDCHFLDIEMGVNVNYKKVLYSGSITMQLNKFFFGTWGIAIVNGQNAWVLYNEFYGVGRGITIANNSLSSICNGNESYSLITSGGVSKKYPTIGLNASTNGKFTNKANFNKFYDGKYGMVFDGKNDAFTTKCNTFNALSGNASGDAIRDILINGTFQTPHGICTGATGWTPQNTFTVHNPVGWFNIESPTTNNMEYRWNASSSYTEPKYTNGLPHVKKLTCAGSANCSVNDIPKPKSYWQPIFYDPGSSSGIINRSTVIVDSINQISPKSADDSALINYYFNERTFYESQMVGYYTANGKYDSAFYLLNNDTNFMTDYLKMNLYLQLDSFSDAQTLANSYSSYSGNDTDLLDFYTYYNLLITGLQDTNFNSWLNVHHSDMYNLGERNSLISGEAKLWYNNWLENNPDSSGTAFNDYPIDTSHIIDTLHVCTVLYPNPTSSLMTVSITNNDITNPAFTHKITDMNGTLKETHSITITAGNTGQYTYDVSAYTAGVYYFYVLQSSKIFAVDIFIKY